MGERHRLNGDRTATDALYDGRYGDDEYLGQGPEKTRHGGAAIPWKRPSTEPPIGEGIPRYGEFVADLYADSRGDTDE